MARAIMLQGTGSSVGKSLLVAGLGRALHRRGLRPAPFKPQNMSNNAAVTADGGEIGRAQALQARACRLEPTTDMNPVLLKPDGAASQVVLHGRVHGRSNARGYQSLKPALLPHVLDSFDRLAGSHDIVLVEGAGSASEINLRAGDIANMGFARARNVPVVVVGDIDRGGVIASLVGTHAVLDPADRALVAGFVVNRMRGDPTLFTDGLRAIEAATGWPALGLVTHFDDAVRLPREDALDLVPTRTAGGKAGRLRVAVPLLPHISNTDDFDPLDADPLVDLLLLPLDQALPADTDLVLLPGSKSTIADLHALRAAGWHHDLHAHHRRGGRILGVCAGLQMLGRTIADPHGLEGPPARTEALGLLDLHTELTPTKRLRLVTGRTVPDHVPLTGYEMHCGHTTGPDRDRPFALLDGNGPGAIPGGTPDGARSADGRVAGTYLHGLFGHDATLAALTGRPRSAHHRHHDERVDAVLDRFADHLEAHIDIDRLLAMSRR